jgi:hypothetical protein
MQKQLFLTLLLFSYLSLFSQTKEIKGDTIIGRYMNSELKKHFNLLDFNKSTNEFNFRFINQGQILEISKDSSFFSGFIINYIFHSKNNKSNKTDTLSNRINLSSNQVEVIYNIILNSKFLDIPTDKDIDKWKHGFDGTTYYIEHNDKSHYWIKNYWCPYLQDSIPEGIIVFNLLKNLSDTLYLKELLDSYSNKLPKRGCYNYGGISSFCYFNKSMELGYSGSVNLPLGFYSYYSRTYIGKVKTNGSAALQYNFNLNGLHHLNLQLEKRNLFLEKPNNYSDFINYCYQNRIVTINEKKTFFTNHQLKYGIRTKKYIGIALGVDYISGNSDKIGGLFYAYKWFSKPNIGTIITTSVFENQINYKTELLKAYNLPRKYWLKRISFGLVYEKFINYTDFYFNIRGLL